MEGNKKCIKNVIDEVKAAWRDKKGIQNYIDFAALTLNVDIIKIFFLLFFSACMLFG